MSDGALATTHEEELHIAGSPLRTAMSVFSFIFAVAGVFIYIGWYVTDIQGGGVANIGSGVSPERGEALFWGDGNCHTCHSMGDRGSMKRCPNLGDSEIGPSIGERAALRARERTEQTGVEYTATAYLVECIANPSAYVVEGFPDNLMPLVYTGQIDLDPEEVMSVITYLQTIGGEMDVEALTQAMSRFGQPILQKDRLKNADPVIVPVDLPYPEWEVFEPEQFAVYHKIIGDEARAAYRADSLDEEQQEIYEEILEEWIEEGEAIFTAKKCWQCHEIKGKDFGALEAGNVGPDLTSIGSIQPREYIMESILTPDALIVPPLEDHSVDGRSKMPSYAEQIQVTDLMKLAVFLSHQTGVTTESGAESVNDTETEETEAEQ